MGNKIVLNKALIILMWVYEVELWGCSSKLNKSIIQKSFKITTESNKRTMVCKPSNNTYRPECITCKERHERKKVRILSQEKRITK